MCLNRHISWAPVVDMLLISREIESYYLQTHITSDILESFGMK